jgi:hypothetical protein
MDAIKNAIIAKSVLKYDLFKAELVKYMIDNSATIATEINNMTDTETTLVHKSTISPHLCNFVEKMTTTCDPMNELCTSIDREYGVDIDVLVDDDDDDIKIDDRIVIILFNVGAAA